jgi:opacity protein-like surface antigen
MTGKKVPRQISGADMKQLWLCVVAAGALLATQAASAQYVAGGGGNGPATGDWELRIGPIFMNSKTVNFQGGATANINSETGVKVGAGYYLTDALVLGGNFSFIHANFDGTAVSANPPGQFQVANGHADLSSFIFDARYKFLDGMFRPWVEAGLGWTWVNTNIASGPPQTGCWWDPWWGYICSGFQPTKNTSAFAYQIGAGFEVNFNRQFGLSAGYLETWEKFSRASGTPSFGGIEVMFNWRFTGY